MSKEIKELQKQLAEVKRQKEALQARMESDAIEKAMNEIEIGICRTKLVVFFDYLRTVQGTNGFKQNDLISNLFKILHE